ncbi:MAG: hypothetical protein VXW97_01935 [Pseudomonadota bacterium]|nr:hypothetical protein [Pseudomonadota bacterium]
MYYHPLIGISIFLIAVIFSFFLGRLYIKKRLNFISQSNDKKKSALPKGEITAPDAPWLDKK